MECKLEDPLLKRSEVQALTTLSDFKLKKLVADKEFPPPVMVTEHRVAWRASDVQAWIDSKPVKVIKDKPQGEARAA